jgi:hypothetical protein
MDILEMREFVRETNAYAQVEIHDFNESDKLDDLLESLDEDFKRYEKEFATLFLHFTRTTKIHDKLVSHMQKLRHNEIPEYVEPSDLDL